MICQIDILFHFPIVGLTYVVHMAETGEKELALIWARLTYNPETSGQFIRSQIECIAKKKKRNPTKHQGSSDR